MTRAQGETIRFRVRRKDGSFVVGGRGGGGCRFYSKEVLGKGLRMGSEVLTGDRRLRGLRVEISE